MRIIKLFSILFACMVSLPVQAGVWTTTTTGTIARGFDYNGLFGTAGRDLSGLRFTQSITASTNPADWELFDQYLNQQELHYVGPSFADTVTVDGRTVTVSATSTMRGTQYIANYRSATRTGDPDLIYSAQSGFTSSGLALQTAQYVVSYLTPFVSTLDYDQTIHRNLDSSFNTSASFSLEGQAWFTATIPYAASGMVDSLDVNFINISEPATSDLAFLGLALLVVLRRSSLTRRFAQLTNSSHTQP